jgi:hypothetical protein
MVCRRKTDYSGKRVKMEKNRAGGDGEANGERAAISFRASFQDAAQRGNEARALGQSCKLIS